MWLNYPNNPTAAVADREFLERAVAFCRRHDIVLCHDAPYSEIAFDGYRPLTLFEIPGAKEIGLEFHSLSKTFNMTGWRIGWVCGRADLVGLIGQLKTNIDSGIFQAVQWAAIEALNGGEEETRAACDVYARRHRLVADTLNELGWNIKPPRATFYVWAPVPKGYDSIGFASHVLDEVGRQHHAGCRLRRARRGLLQAVGHGTGRPPRRGDGADEEAQALKSPSDDHDQVAARAGVSHRRSAPGLDRRNWCTSRWSSSPTSRAPPVPTSSARTCSARTEVDASALHRHGQGRRAARA